MTDLSPDLKRSDAFATLLAAFQGHVTYRGALKRVFDIAVCLLLLPAVGPTILLLYVLARSDGGVGFFKHTRCGRYGQTFPCWKIRTMVPNAEDRLTPMLRQNVELEQEWLASQKLKEDPRMTVLGRVIRKTGLDELPQVWNVLRGDMSLIGPRPVTESELLRYGSDRSFYNTLRPGITGLWQVSGRNEVNYQRRIEMDRVYSQTLSFRLDLVILLKTIWVVLKRTGY